MIDLIAIYLFGAISIAIPLLIFYLQGIGKQYIQECQKTKEGLEETLTKLNQLHNNALAEHKTLETRLIKLETAHAVQNYGVSKR